ncbi:hypothetical protein GM658_01225 [Pseudoduganella eburnea]|uniref:Uncharacterized protein n=1 Tax=Massilia eburnea TaxID=1776165 RepID=A0A6L6QAY9_9BURK|nr:hypothetical protein [Massilia eburnea]MTW09211.1 hypothetical protein [Massilia eburnea]
MRKLLLALSLLLACLASAAESPIAPEQRRSVEQTFLTFPEWFLVHSPAEYARYVKQHPAHGFPFLGHVGQIWTSYAAVTEEQVRAKYPNNAGYHVMIGVIGSSTTVEYALRSLYENTLGRISWATASALTPEDEYGARVAQDYVDFIRKEPWYLYDFSAKLKGLWAETPLVGENMLRKLERRYALTTEYLIKATYGKLIKLATSAAYEPALMTTQVVADHEPYDLSDQPNVKLLRILDDGRAVLELPRYYDFRLAATKLGLQDVQLQDIAGNSSVILVTVLTRSHGTAAPPDSRVLFEQPILTEPGRKRVALVLPVAALSRYLVDAPRQGVEVEHVYDY